jgi:hypothetical protein
MVHKGNGHKCFTRRFEPQLSAGAATDFTTFGRNAYDRKKINGLFSSRILPMPVAAVNVRPKYNATHTSEFRKLRTLEDPPYKAFFDSASTCSMPPGIPVPAGSHFTG